MKYQGKSQHKLRGLTTTILGGFLNDLNQLEKVGYTEVECNMVKDVLQKINENCQQIATSVWMSQIALDYGDFYAAYERWNGHGTATSNDAITERRENLKSLRKFREKWGKNVSKNHKRKMGSDDDVAFFSDESVKLLQTLSNEHPHYFKNLNGAIEPYFNRTLSI